MVDLGYWVFMFMVTDDGTEVQSFRARHFLMAGRWWANKRRNGKWREETMAARH